MAEMEYNIHNYVFMSVLSLLCHCRLTYMIGKGGVRAGAFSLLKSATSQLDATKSYILLL